MLKHLFLNFFSHRKGSTSKSFSHGKYSFPICIRGGSHDFIALVNLFDYYIQVQVRDNDKVLMHNKLNISYTYIVSILSHVLKLICIFVY